MTTDTLIKTQDAERINDTRKGELLSTPIEHIDITSFDARPIIDSMGKMSFTSRDLARATGIYNQMLEDPACSIILVIAGSTSAGGFICRIATSARRTGCFWRAWRGTPWRSRSTNRRACWSARPTTSWSPPRSRPASICFQAWSGWATPW